MKKVLVLVLAIVCLSDANAQQTSGKRPQLFGVSFFLNDFETAENIRNSSLVSVLRDKETTGLSDMTPGIGVTYFRGLTNNIDFAATVGASFPKVRLSGESEVRERFLLETDASVLLNMLSPGYTVTPYLSAGIGASLYGGRWSGIIPAGAGLRFRLSDESAVHLSGQYRIPMITEANNYHFQFGLGFASNIGGN